MRHEYLYAPREPRAGRAGWTEQAANAPNGNVDNFHVFPRFWKRATLSRRSKSVLISRATAGGRTVYMPVSTLSQYNRICTCIIGGEALKRKIAFALAALSILVVLTATANSAVAAPLPGVKAGDTADYKVVGYPAYNTTHITVWGTKGAYVALTATNYKANGSLYSVSNRNQSVAQYGGASWATVGIFFWVVSKNLTVGPGEILGMSPGVFVRNNLTMTAAGVSRFVLHANGSASGRVTYLDMYFDRETGLVVQGNYRSAAGWNNVTLISTNVWSGAGGLSAEALLAIGEGAVIVVLFVAMVFFAVRARKHKA
jgi:hypothetical protein